MSQLVLVGLLSSLALLLLLLESFNLDLVGAKELLLLTSGLLVLAGRELRTGQQMIDLL